MRLEEFVSFSRLRFCCKIALIVLLVFWFTFALLSGAAKFGGGIRGVLLNVPNAVPWAILVGIVGATWKRDFFGSVVILGIGIGSVFILYKTTFTLIGISLPITGIGVLLLLSCFIEHK